MKKVWTIILCLWLLGTLSLFAAAEETDADAAAEAGQTTGEETEEETAPETVPPRDPSETFIGELYGELSEEDLVYLLLYEDGSIYTGEPIIGDTGLEAPPPPFEAVIIGYEGFAGKVTVPSVLDGVPVTRVEPYAFRMNAYITEIVLPSSAVTVGEFAFEDCENLRRVTMSEGTVSIGRGAFSGCKRLSEVLLPESLREIGEECFMGCRQLRSLTFPIGLTYIGDDAFMGCERLKVECKSDYALAYAEKWRLVMWDDYTEERNIAIVGGVLLLAVAVWAVLAVRKRLRKKADIAARKAALLADTKEVCGS